MTVSSLLRTVICMVTPSASASRARTRTSWPPRNTPERRETSECEQTRVKTTRLFNVRHAPARKRTCEFLFSGTLSDRSHGCIPRKLMIFPTASVQHRRTSGKCWRWTTSLNHVLNIPSNVRTDARANVSSFSKSSPTSSHAAPKFGLRTFWMWSATVTSKSSSWDRGMERNIVLYQWQDTNITLSTVRWCVVGTYHILIVVTVVIRLSCVGVTVPDKIFHGAAERTRHWRETRWVNTDEEQSVCIKKTKKTHQLLGRHQAGGRVSSRTQADCRADWWPGCSVTPRRPPMAPSAPPPEIHRLCIKIWPDDFWNNLRGPSD